MSETPDTRTIQVERMFGDGTRPITKEEFIRRWAALAHDLANLDIWILDEVNTKAAARFEELYAKENPQEVADA